MQKQLVRFIAGLIVAVIAALLGQNQSGRQREAQGPLPGEIRGAGRAIDGDSLRVGTHEVRLQGIDAPEGRQTCKRDGADWPCGDAARDELRRLIGSDVVTCRVTERDKHGRFLSYCSSGNRDINGGMVASGFAVAYGGYTREQADAKARRRGLWSGEFQQPRDWRHERGIGQ
ncbi:MAG: thermonuclease family protein [Hyphomicrobium sp.]